MQPPITRVIPLDYKKLYEQAKTTISELVADNYLLEEKNRVATEEINTLLENNRRLIIIIGKLTVRLEEQEQGQKEKQDSASTTIPIPRLIRTTNHPDDPHNQIYADQMV
jgi:hypothetical protein